MMGGNGLDFFFNFKKWERLSHPKANFFEPAFPLLNTHFLLVIGPIGQSMCFLRNHSAAPERHEPVTFFFFFSYGKDYKKVIQGKCFECSKSMRKSQEGFFVLKLFGSN